MHGSSLRSRIGWVFSLAAAFFLFPAMTLFSQERVSSVKEPFTCPVGGLVSCGTEFLRFSFGTGFHIVYARRPETYNLSIYGLKPLPAPPQHDSMVPVKRPAITADGRIPQSIDDTRPIYGIGRDCEFRIDLGCSTIFGGPSEVAVFAFTGTGPEFRERQ